METDEKRLEGRFLCADLVRLDWISGEDNLRSELALLEVIAAQGGCVQRDVPLPLGVSVMLTVGSTPFYGHVCYCTFRDDAYFIGLRFADETMWSASLVETRHLINLHSLG